MFKIWGSTYQPNLASQVQISGSMMDLLNLGPVTKLRMSSWLYGGLLVRPNSLQTRTHKSLGLDFNSKVVFNNIVSTNLCDLFFLCLWFPTPIFVGPGTSSQRACNLLLLTAKGDRADGHFWVYLFSGWSFWGMRVFENPSENLYVARMVFLFKMFAAVQSSMQNALQFPRCWWYQGNTPESSYVPKLWWRKFLGQVEAHRYPMSRCYLCPKDVHEIPPVSCHVCTRIFKESKSHGINRCPLNKKMKVSIVDGVLVLYLSPWTELSNTDSMDLHRGVLQWSQRLYTSEVILGELGKMLSSDFKGFRMKNRTSLPFGPGTFRGEHCHE